MPKADRRRQWSESLLAKAPQALPECAPVNDTLAIPGFSDPISSLTHLIGAGVVLVASGFLLRHGWGKPWTFLSLLIFCLACLFMLSMSGVYHLLSPEGAARPILQRLDHSAIFILIVATMTPIHQILFKGVLRSGFLLLIWAIAITAVTLKSIFFSAFPEWLSLSLFLGLGWAGLVTCIGLWLQRDLAFTRWIMLGGVAYTLGAVLEFLGQPVLIPGVLGPHELFHVAVLIGLACHWRFIVRIARMDAAEIAGVRDRPVLGGTP